MRYQHGVTVVLAVVSIATLSGCAAPVAVHTNAPVVAAPSATPTPTPAEAGPTVRVPTTCDALVPHAAADAAAGVSVVAAKPERSANPVSYADDREGALTCRWSSDPARSYLETTNVYVTIVPDVTTSAFDDERHGIGVGGEDRQAAYGADSYSFCNFMGWATSCVFRELVNGYGVAGSVARAGNTVDSRTDAAMATLFSSVNSAVSAFAPPSALWEPSAGSINGASTCNQLATPAQITTVFPIEGPHEAKGEGGEDAISTLGAAQLVDSYYCILTATSGTFSLELAVLPGGALYVDTAERARVASGGAPGQVVTGVGDRALYDQKTGTLDVVAGGGWVQVGDATARLDQLTAMAKAVLSNLGYH